MSGRVDLLTWALLKRNMPSTDLFVFDHGFPSYLAKNVGACGTAHVTRQVERDARILPPATRGQSFVRK
jgi:hypothetical protein